MTQSRPPRIDTANIRALAFGKQSFAALTLAMALNVGPLFAETPPGPTPLPPKAEAEGSAKEGLSLMEQGAQILLRGLMAEMEPSLNEMGDALREMGPSLKEMGPQIRELLAMMGDISNYHAPEKLENGDILIRRKANTLPPSERKVWPPAQGPNGEIEL